MIEISGSTWEAVAQLYPRHVTTLGSNRKMLQKRFDRVSLSVTLESVKQAMSHNVRFLRMKSIF